MSADELSLPANPAKSAREHLKPLGWAGWWLPLPESWRILNLQGHYRNGSLHLGNSEQLCLELKWIWVSKIRFQPGKFLRRFLLQGIPGRERKQTAGKLVEWNLPHFSDALALEDGDKIWAAAYSPETSRILHWVLHRTAPGAKLFRDWMEKWKDQPVEQPMAWSFFGASFQVPAGFLFSSANLQLGDMEVVLKDASGWHARHQLIVRHIHPASLALARRPLGTWLTELFKVKRGAYVLVEKTRADSSDPVEGQSVLGRLHLFLRLFLRPLFFRMPGRVEASIWHLEARNQLRYLQMTASARRIEESRDLLLSDAKKGSFYE